MLGWKREGKWLSMGARFCRRGWEDAGGGLFNLWDPGVSMGRGGRSREGGWGKGGVRKYGW